MPDYRVTLVVKNTLTIPIKCVSIDCKSFDVKGSELRLGTVLQPNETGIYKSTTNDRIFCKWESLGGGGVWYLAMTQPRSSGSSACDCLSLFPTYPGNAGLQPYDNNVPATFTFNIGQPNRADWRHSDNNEYSVVTYGDCSPS